MPDIKNYLKEGIFAYDDKYKKFLKKSL